MRLVLDLRLLTRGLLRSASLPPWLLREAPAPAGRSPAVVPFIHPPHGVVRTARLGTVGDVEAMIAVSISMRGS